MGGVWRGPVALRRAPWRQVVRWRAGATLPRGERAVQRGQTATGVEERRLLGDLPEQRRPLLTAGDKHRRTHCMSPHTHTHTHTHTHSVCNTGASVLPVLSLLSLGLLVASRHLGFVARLPGRADLDGCVFKRGGRYGDFGAALRGKE